ncbi:MAG: hypothetical protein JRN15_20680, partial [Nitrososphaerota archaeon]|nr:hypothetical protein [Nitrososphaerota archaeon]
MMSAREPLEEQENSLIDPEVQSLIQHMVDAGEYSIVPKLDPTGISFHSLSLVFPGKTDAEIADFLDRLADEHILRAKLLDKVIVCPTCGSPSVYTKYNCPRCSSF